MSRRNLAQQDERTVSWYNWPSLLAELGYVLLVALVAIQGGAIVDGRRRLNALRQQFLTSLGPNTNVTQMLRERRLPSLDGVGADGLERASWEAYLPNGDGLVIVLSTNDEVSWILAHRLGPRPELWARDPFVILIEAEALEAERLMVRTKLPKDRVVLLGDHSNALETLGVRWHPAALVVSNYTVVVAAQVYDALHLRQLEHGIRSNGLDELEPVTSRPTR